MKTRSPRVLLEQMLEAARAAVSFVEGLDKGAFLADLRTQHAVSMALLTIGEMAGRLVRRHPDFIAASSEIQWDRIQAMRHRIAHGYFELDFNIVWDTVQHDAPDLLARLPPLIMATAAGGDASKHS